MSADIRAALATVEAKGARLAATAVRTAIARLVGRIAPALPPGLYAAGTPDGVIIRGRAVRRRLIDSGRWEAIRR